MNIHAALAQWSAAWWPWFLNHLWQATAFAVVAIILVALLRGTSARTRYAVLLVALAKFAVPAAFLATIVDDAGLRPEPLQWQTQPLSETHRPQPTNRAWRHRARDCGRARPRPHRDRGDSQGRRRAMK